MSVIDYYPPKNRNNRNNRENLNKYTFCRWYNTREPHFYKRFNISDEFDLRLHIEDEIIVSKNRLQALDAIKNNFSLCNSNPNGTNSPCRRERNSISK